MATETDAARDRVLAARAALGDELETLEASARAAIDIPAKIRRSPVKAAAVAGGAGFVVLGGPRRVFRRVKRAVRGPEAPLPTSMLPDEIEKTLRSLGSDGDKVRGTLERDFAAYTKNAAKDRTRLRTLLFVAVLRPVVLRASKVAAEKVFSTDAEGFQKRLGQVQARIARVERRQTDVEHEIDQSGLGAATVDSSTTPGSGAARWTRPRASGGMADAPALGAGAAQAAWRFDPSLAYDGVPAAAIPTEGGRLGSIARILLADHRRGIRPYTSRAMQITRTPGPRSTIDLQIEVPADRLDRAIQEAVRHLARRTRVPGFRPGKAPRAFLERQLAPGAVLEDAVDHLVQDSYREALTQEDILPLTNAEVDVVQAEEGKPLIFKVSVQVRPEVALGDYRNFNFAPEIDPIDDARVDQVLDELRDQNATLAAVEDRGAQDGDYAVISFTGTRDGEPFEGGTSERMPLILGQERLIPGFEANLHGLRVGESTAFDITFPEDYPETAMAGQPAHFEVELRELREKVLPDLDADFVGTLGDFADVAALRADIRSRLERNALDRARHGFADRIIEYAVANATVELPDILVDQEVEVMHDEFRATLARQGITEEAYLKAVEKTEADLHADFRPGAEKRARTLLVLSKVADVEGVTIPDAEVEAEIARGRERYADDPKLLAYFDSERGRSYIRSTLRRSRVVEGLIDGWLAAHPEHPPLPHIEDAPPTGVESDEAAANAAVDATDPGSVLADVPAPAG